MLAEQEMMGLSPGDHVLTLYRRQLVAQRVHGSRSLAGCRNGQRVRVAGLLVVHQSPPTAKGFHFLTLEDEDGMMNVIVRPQIYGRYQNIIRSARLLLVAGVAQREEGVINVLADAVAALRG
jgi:error-prone DNA polymerase